MNRRRGLTLIELMIALVIAGTLSAALARAYAVGAGIPGRTTASRESADARMRFEDHLRSIFEEAVLSADTGSTSSYFLAGADATGEAARVTFTRQADPIKGPQLASDGLFEEQNSRFGPAGGLVEISIGPTAVGSNPQGEGVFIRTQRPSDGDHEQGGTETVLEAPLEEWNIELFDGLTWVVDWDTRVGQRRLPSAARITYRLEGQDLPSTLVIRLRHSDITPDNPLQTDTGGGR